MNFHFAVPPPAKKEDCVKILQGKKLQQRSASQQFMLKQLFSENHQRFWSEVGTSSITQTGDKNLHGHLESSNYLP